MIKGIENNVVEFGQADWKVWADRINDAWQKSINGILESGRLLIRAKDKLDHGNFEKMIQSELNFGENTAQRLMNIARNPTLANPDHGQLLPPSWRTLDELDRAERKLGEGTISRWLAEGTVTPKTERREIVALIAPPKRAKTEYKRKRHRKPQYHSPEETVHDLDLRALLGIWESACESARRAFLEQVTR
jgi:hypothetical protein